MFCLLALILFDVPRFEALAVDSTASGEITELKAGWSARVGGSEIRPGQLIELRRLDGPRPAAPTDQPHIRLLGGDIWPGRVLGIADDQLVFDADLGVRAELRLPIAAVAEVWLGSSRPVAGPRSSDEILLANGDVLRGTVVRWIKNDLEIESAGRSTTVEVGRVAGIAFAEPPAPAKPKPATGLLVLTNGARITVREANLVDGRIVGLTPAGITARVRLADLAGLIVLGGPATYLSDLAEIRYEHVPFLGARFPLGRNRTSAGTPLRIAGDTFDRGIGLHSQARVSYAIPKAARRFEAWVGLDAALGTRGQARFAVEIDGVMRFGPSDIAGGGPAVPVAVSWPAGARELRLLVDFGPLGDVGDHVNWANARFVGPAVKSP